MSKIFKIGQTVKYSNPQEGEDNLLFTITEIHPKDGNIGEKLHVRLICSEDIRPTFCEFSEEYEPT